MAVAAKTSATLTGRAGFYDYPALAAIADRLFVMAWDLHWATSPAGPISDATWVGKIIKYVMTVPNASRFTIGTQLYGFDWPLGAKATPLEWDDMTAMQARSARRRPGTPWPRSRTSPTRTARASCTRPTTPTHRACRGGSARRARQDSASDSGASATKTRRHGASHHSRPDAHRRPLRRALLAQPARRLLPAARGHRLVHQELLPARALARPAVRALQPLRDASTCSPASASRCSTTRYAAGPTSCRASPS